MASRATNEAVEAYRKLVKAERKVDQLEQELTRAIRTRGFELDSYVRMTFEIDAAANAQSLNEAGLDG